MLMVLPGMLVSAQQAEHSVKFTHFGLREGLSQSSVFALYQDYLGFMWIGTRDGLNRYDTRTFTTYRNAPSDSTSLSNNYILSILEDSQQRLWVGTNSGVNLYDRRQDHFVRYSLVHNQSGNMTSEPTVSAIVEGRAGRVWFATSQGLYCLDGDAGDDQLKLVFDANMYNAQGVSLSTNNVQSFHEDDKGNIWLSTVNGALVFDPYQPNRPLRLAHYFQHRMGELNSAHVRVIMQVGDGVYWLGTMDGGINVYNAATQTFDYIMHQPNASGWSLASNDVRSILKDRYGGYWVGTINGLNYYTEEDGFRTHTANSFDQFSLSDNSIRPIFQDSRGSVWVGTFYGGVCVYDRHIPLFRNYAHSPFVSSLSYNVVSSILEDDKQNLWIGTEGGGLNYLDRGRQVFRHYRHDPNHVGSISHNNVKSLFLDSRGDLWVGTYAGGLNVMRKGSRTFQHFQHDPAVSHSLSHNNVYSIAEDTEGNLWLGTYGGGLNLKKAGGGMHFESYRAIKTGRYHISSDLVRMVFFDSRNNLWVGTENGLNLRRHGSDHFEVFRHDAMDTNSISGNIVVSIFEDSEQRLWFGTYKDGLNQYHHESNSFSRIDGQDRLTESSVFGILESGSQLWLSTNNGISSFDPASGAVNSYNTKDGIGGNEFSMGAYYETSNGELVFGGSHGLTVFDPGDFIASNYVPPVIITDFRLFNKSVEPEPNGVLAKPISITDTIILKHEQRIFTIEFAAINYILAEKNKYAYRLDGLEEEWNYVDIPAATYTNLHPGTYTFLAMGSSNDGIWNDVPRALTIRILPPPWKTWWAYLIYATLIGLGIYVIVRFTRIRSRLEHRLQLEHLENERQREINEIKLNFFASISHEFRTPLTLILAPVQHLLSNMKLEDSTRSMMATVKSNSLRLLNLVNQLLDFRKQETGNIQLHVADRDFVGFMDKIAAEFELFAEQQGVLFQYERPVSPIQAWFDADQMEKVVYNLLSNAFKFVPLGGLVKLSVDEIAPSDQYPEGSVAIRVWDNGNGIPDEKLGSIFEFFYQFNADGDENRQNFGSGIGLALAKNLTEIHGGTIRVHSYDGKEQATYTCFTVELPLGNSHFDSDLLMDGPSDQSHNAWIDELATIEPGNPDLVNQAEEETYLQPLILVVEDNVEIRRIILETLKADYSLLEASNGEEGWELVKSRLPDLVIADIRMPVADGISLLKNIKQRMETNHIPVLLVTARTSMENVIEGLEYGGDDYITKPFHLDVLSLKVRNILAARERFRKKFIRDYVLTPQQDTPTESADQQFLREVLHRIENNLGEPRFNVNSLASDLNISRPVLYRKLKQLTDFSVIELINVVRLRKAGQLLENKGLTISQVAYQVGFSDPKYFSKSFKGYFGKSPSEYAALDQTVQQHMLSLVDGIATKN